MPTRLPNKPRAKSIPVDERIVHPDAHDDSPRTSDAKEWSNLRQGTSGGRDPREETLDTIDWLALFTLSLGFSAMFMAALVYAEGDTTTASAILFGTACIIAVCLGVSKAPGSSK